MDYQGNSKKDKDKNKDLPEKKVEKVVENPVVVKKKPFGRRIKDVFIEADFRNAARHVFVNVLIPAARNTIMEGAYKGIEMLVYGEAGARGRMGGPGSRTTYNRPVQREYRGIERWAPPVPSHPRGRRRPVQDNYIVGSREEALLILERMKDIVDTYQVVSQADLLELCDLPSSHVDNKWGWVYVDDVPVRQVHEGFLIDLPPAEPITNQ